MLLLHSSDRVVRHDEGLNPSGCLCVYVCLRSMLDSCRSKDLWLVRCFGPRTAAALFQGQGFGSDPDLAAERVVTSVEIHPQTCRGSIGLRALGSPLLQYIVQLLFGHLAMDVRVHHDRALWWVTCC